MRALGLREMINEKSLFLGSRISYAADLSRLDVSARRRRKRSAWLSDAHSTMLAAARS
jgi:hypothetical protein